MVRLGLMLLAGWHVLDSPFLLRLLWQKVGSGFSYASSRHDLSGRWNLAKHIFSLRLTDSRHHSDLLTLPAPPCQPALATLSHFSRSYQVHTTGRLSSEEAAGTQVPLWRTLSRCGQHQAHL